jgi:hypothetical protein
MAVLMAGPVAMIYKSLDLNKSTINNKGLFGTGLGLGILLRGLQLGLYKIISLVNAPFMRAFGYEFRGTKN